MRMIAIVAELNQKTFFRKPRPLSFVPPPTTLSLVNPLFSIRKDWGDLGTVGMGGEWGVEIDSTGNLNFFSKRGRLLVKNE